MFWYSTHRWLLTGSFYSLATENNLWALWAHFRPLKLTRVAESELITLGTRGTENWLPSASLALITIARDSAQMISFMSMRVAACGVEGKDHNWPGKSSLCVVRRWACLNRPQRKQSIKGPRSSMDHEIAWYVCLHLVTHVSVGTGDIVTATAPTVQLRANRGFSLYDNI